MATSLIPTAAQPSWANTGSSGIPFQNTPATWMHMLHPAAAASGPLGGAFGSGTLGRALANVLTLGYAQHPVVAHQYFNQIAQSYNPNHPAGAVNLLSTVIPGRGGFTSGTAALSREMASPALSSPSAAGFQAPQSGISMLQGLTNRLGAGGWF